MIHAIIDLTVIPNGVALLLHVLYFSYTPLFYLFINERQIGLFIRL